MSYNAKNFTEQGGDVTHIGGSLVIEEGGSVQGLPSDILPSVVVIPIMQTGETNVTFSEIYNLVHKQHKIVFFIKSTHNEDADYSEVKMVKRVACFPNDTNNEYTFDTYFFSDPSDGIGMGGSGNTKIHF